MLLPPEWLPETWQALLSDGTGVLLVYLLDPPSFPILFRLWKVPQSLHKQKLHLMQSI